MKAGNHVAGGLVFTGFFASLWNINIFQSFDTFLFASIATLLPDIDHTKSIVGKAFYPLAKWLDRNYGHRTITHSLLFISLISLISYIIENHFFNSSTYTIILFFSVFSHYILDMITVQGIPLFYPFYRNPCVIPGNPSMRVRTNDMRAEVIAFALFFLVGLTSMDLFRNGFWTSYNRAFGTLKHLHRENINSVNILKCEYYYTVNGSNKKGNAFVINTTENTALLFERFNLFAIANDEKTRVKYVKPFKTKNKKIIKEIGFLDIDQDSLKNILSGRIISGVIQSNLPFTYHEKNIAQTTKTIKLKDSYDFKFTVSNKQPEQEIEAKINALKIKLNKNKQEHFECAKKIKNINKKIDSLKNTSSKISGLYEKNKIKSEIIELKKTFASLKKEIKPYKEDELIKYEIDLLERSQQETLQKFSGYLSFPVIPSLWIEGKISKIIDGDSFILKKKSGEKENIRLYGIDAPEHHQKYFSESKQFLAAFLNNNCVLLVKNKDEYNRTVAELFVNDTNIGKLSLKLGFAWHFKRYSSDKDYADCENQARLKQKGLWGHEKPTPPWEFRNAKNIKHK